MQKPSFGFPYFCFCVLGIVSLPLGVAPQTTPSATPQAAAPAVKLDYADNPSGLEKLAKDIMKAQRENNPSRAGALLQTLVLPNPRAWYSRVFGEPISEKEGAQYEAIAGRIPLDLATAFVNASRERMTAISAVRFDKSCDDNAGEMIFGILQARLDHVPLYELRFFSGNQSRRLFPFAYVDGGFRFIISPKMEEFDSHPTHDPRIRVGGYVTAARIVNRVSPHYPDRARKEHLQGIVKLHAIIGKDGTIRHLNVISGYCSLAEAALEAVRQWRYQPTLLNGDPLEVDTTVDVTFQLNP